MALSGSELKYLLALQTKKGRKQELRFLAEGVRLLEAAIAADYLPTAVFYTPAAIDSRGQQLVAALINRRVTAQTISAKECQRLSDTTTSQGIIAVFEYKKPSLEQQLAKGSRKILICDKVGDPGNMGTLIRSAAAFHFDLVITTAGAAETTGPKTLRASMGGYFQIPVIDGVDDDDLSAQVKKAGYHIYLADVKGNYVSSSLPISEKMALVIGAETAGPGRVLAGQADYRIKIPMSKKCESLNAAMAGTILMFWLSSRERMARR